MHSLSFRFSLLSLSRRREIVLAAAITVTMYTEFILHNRFSRVEQMNPADSYDMLGAPAPCRLTAHSNASSRPNKRHLPINLQAKAAILAEIQCCAKGDSGGDRWQ